MPASAKSKMPPLSYTVLRGCGFHYRCHVRSGQSPVYELECADLRNNDVIFGGEKKLTALLQKVEREQKAGDYFSVAFRSIGYY